MRPFVRILRSLVAFGHRRTVAHYDVLSLSVTCSDLIVAKIEALWESVSSMRCS